ncbi:MAG: threonine synthase [Planctomycetota bacterium]|nr:threonine synthase [Planctomycetota bacterium]
MSCDAWFRDAITREGRWELDQIVYRSDAGNLLEVTHDLDALRAQHDADGWRALWDQRYRRAPYPLQSGVWGKKELVLPGIPDEHVVSLGEGATPLVHTGRYGEQLGLDELYLKQCGTTHTGSFKDLGMTVLVSQVNHIVKSSDSGILGVACASTGDTSAALAAYCAAAGLPSVVLLPYAKISPAQLIQPIANGALTLALDTDFDGCMRLIQQLTEDRKLYLANSMNSLRVEGQKTVGIEIIQQLDWNVPDWVLIPGGNLGNVSALYKGFEELLALGVIKRMPRVVCCQAEAANPLYRAYQNDWAFEAITAGPTQASAIRIGDPVSLPKAVAALQKHGGMVEQASEQELADECALADRCGQFTCPHTGVALAALRKLVTAGTIRKHERVVVVSTAHGLKFSNVKADYHGDGIAGIEAHHANRPVRLDATRDAVYDAVMRHIDTTLA